MAFGKPTAFCVTRAYGCGLPAEGEGEALAEMRRRSDLWNRYVELERRFEQQYEDALAALDGEYAEALAAERAAWDGVRAATGSVARGVARERARTATTAARAAAKTARETHREAWRAALIRLDGEREAAARLLRQQNDCYVYNSTDVFLAYQTARTEARKRGDRLRFQRWAGEGKLAVQFTVPPDVDAVFAGPGDTGLLRLERGAVDRAWAAGATRSEQRHAARTTVWFRVCSRRQEGRRPAPVWVTLPVVLHRPLPPGTIQSASLQRRALGRTWRWSLVLTVRVASGAPAPSELPGTVAVDLGWRQRFDKEGVPAGVRVAVAHDDAGSAVELVLGQSWLARLARCDELRALRREKADALRQALSAWKRVAGGAWPEWLAARLAPGALAWHSEAALERLVWEWRFLRFAGDTAYNELAETWRERDIHLGEWEAHERDQLLRQRRDGYRVFAKVVAERYGEIRIEALDLRPLVQAKQENAAGAPQAAGAHGQPKERRWRRFAAAPSTLVQAIESAARLRGVAVVRVNAVNTTAECPTCGAVVPVDAAAQIEVTCPLCGQARDQDAGAALVLLHRAPDAPLLAGAALGHRPSMPLTVTIGDTRQGTVHDPARGDDPHDGQVVGRTLAGSGA